MKKTLLAVCISFFVFNASAQDGIKIFLDTKWFTNLDCSLGGGQSNPSPLPAIYMHSGICTTGPMYCQTQIIPLNSMVWEHVVGNWGDVPQDDGIGEMTNEGNGIWSLEINNYTSYYGDSGIVNLDTIVGGALISTPMSPGEIPYTMGLIFRSADATQSGRDNFCTDIFITNLHTNNPIVIQGGDPDLNEWPNSPVTFQRIINGILVSNVDSHNQQSFAFPNPATNFVSFNLPSELFNVDATLSVIDLSGKQVITEHIQKTKNGVHTLNVSELPNGIYFITLNSANKNYNSKLIINN